MTEKYDATAEAAEALKHMRRKRSVTQAVLAETTGIAQADISRMERGHGNPSLKTLDRIAQGLQCRLTIDFVEDAKNDESGI